MEVIRSETWLAEGFDEDINRILKKTINEFVGGDEEIVNIEMKTDKSGLSRFWIYVKKEE